MPMAYHDQAWLADRVAEWQATGYYPSRIAPLVAPSEWEQNMPYLKTIEAWRDEIRYVLDGNARGMAVFDQRDLANNPLMADVLKNEW